MANLHIFLHCLLLLTYVNITIEAFSRLLAFGDSLTEGFFLDEETGRVKFHSYSIMLQKLLLNTTVSESGISGERTTSMIRRLPILLTSHAPDIVVILGGTNDLYAFRLSNKVSHKILSNLIYLHFIALSDSNVKATLPVTIPPLTNALDLDDKVRQTVNKGIIIFSQECLNSPWLSLESIWQGETNTTFWSKDMVHFSPKGYDEIGNMIYSLLPTIESRTAGQRKKEGIPSKNSLTVGDASALAEKILLYVNQMRIGDRFQCI